MNWWYDKPTPSVRERRRRAQQAGQGLAKQGRKLSPVVVEGRQIAASFWGKAWCQNLESYRDYENRLPRGRSYVRNGSVLDLSISTGKIAALVFGSDIYEVDIGITPLAPARWSSVKSRCAGQVGSLIDLLEGRLSEAVMRIMTDPSEGLFPKPTEIQMSCSCPDAARMCKHIAAVMYGVGARLDERPDLLFLLRHVDHAELIAGATQLKAPRRGSLRKTIAAADLGDVFGIEIAPEAPRKQRPPPRQPATTARRTVKKRSVNR
jgi:uncharacterized Zn finger protein